MSCGEENFSISRQENMSESENINRSPSQTSLDPKALFILEELNKIYEERLSDIDNKAGGDNQLKYVTCMEWIEMLNRVNKDLLVALSELEYEASKRISLLETKLKLECTVDHSNEVEKLKSDVCNLLNFIKKSIEKRKWDTEGLIFFTISPSDIIKDCANTECPNVISDTMIKKLNSELSVNKHELKRLESEQHVLKTELSNKDLQINKYIKKIKELEKQLKQKSQSFDQISENQSYEACVNELKNSLQEKEIQLAEKLQQNECLKTELHLTKNKNVQKDQMIINLRALAFEVAEKHDQVQQMRSEIFSLEEELKKAHKKVQFKDNVIIELRKECKNIPKCSCLSKSINTSPRTFEDKSCHSSAIEELDELETSPSSFSNLIGNSSGIHTQRTNSFDTILETETDKIRAGYELEAYYMKIYKNELDELFKIIISTRDQLSDCEKKRVESQKNKLEEIIKQMLVRLCKVRTKLKYIRKQLNIMNCGSNNDEESDTDSGYSQEDMEPELSMIRSIDHNLQSLKNENCELKERILNYEKEIRNYCTNDDILKEILTALSNMCDENISTNCSEVLLKNSNNNFESEYKNPLCKVISNVENLLIGKSQLIRKLETNVDDLKKSLQCIKAKKAVLEYEIEAKDQTIRDLQETVKEYIKTIEMIEAARVDLQMQLEEAIKKDDSNAKYTEILEAKNKLEIEQFLELDVVCDQLFQYSEEIRHLDQMIIKLRDENVDLNCVLIDYKSELQRFEEKSIKSNEMEKEFLDKEKNYREIIDELTSELANLSTQVTMAQEELKDEDISSIPFEESFRELETQNDLLQTTIESLQSETMKLQSKLKDKEFKTEQLKNQIESLEKIIEQKTKKYDDLNCKYNGLICAIQQFQNKCKCSASNTIKNDIQELGCVHNKKPHELQHIFEMLDRKDDELRAFKEYSADDKNRLRKNIMELEDQIKQLNIKLSLTESALEKRDQELKMTKARLLESVQKDEERRLKDLIDQLSKELDEIKTIYKERETTLIEDINRLREYSEEQTKALIKANDTIVILEKQGNSYRKQIDNINKENASLKEENFSLQEELTSQKNIKKNLHEKLQKNQNELSAAKRDIERLNSHNEEIENFRKNCNRLKDSNYNLARKYNELVDEYNNLEEEYKKLLDIKDHMLKELEIVRNWQHEQSRQDKFTHAKMNKLEEHIRTLMEDRQALITKLNDLHRDISLTHHELEHYKDVFSDALSEANERVTPNSPNYSSGNTDSLLRKIRRIAWKASQTHSIWEDATRRFSE